MLIEGLPYQLSNKNTDFMDIYIHTLFYNYYRTDRFSGWLLTEGGVASNEE